MKKIKNFFYDLEFLEGPQQKRILGVPTGALTKPTIEIISIGMASDDGATYYAVSKEFNLKEAWNRYQKEVNKDFPHGPEYIKVYWIRDNVLKPIFDEWVKEDSRWINKDVTLGNWEFNYKNFKYFLERKGKTYKEIAEGIKRFVYRDNNLDTWLDLYKLRFWAYYADYDHVALCWLFGKMIELPKGFPKYTHDLKQLMDSVDKARLIEFIESGFNWRDFKSVEKLKGFPENKKEHVAIADAIWNKKLFDFLDQF